MVHPRGVMWFHPRHSTRSSAREHSGKCTTKCEEPAPLDRPLNRAAPLRRIIRSIIKEIGRLTTRFGTRFNASFEFQSNVSRLSPRVASVSKKESRLEEFGIISIFTERRDISRSRAIYLHFAISRFKRSGGQAPPLPLYSIHEEEKSWERKMEITYPVWARFKRGRWTRHSRRKGRRKKCVIQPDVRAGGNLLTIMLHLSVVRQNCRRGWESTSVRSRKRLAPLWARIAQTCLGQPCVYVYTR